MAIRRPKVKRPAPASPSVSAKKPVRAKAGKIDDKPAKSAVVKGAAGFAAAQKQQERQQEEYERRKEKPFAFRITQKDISDRKNEVELLYLDEEPFFVRLHTVKNARGGFDDEVCIADTGETCPLCVKLGKEGTHTLVLTALDKRAYRNREGQLIKMSKKLVPVKSRNIAKFERQWKKHGTFRGLVAVHRRHGQKEASIGEDIEFKEKLVPELMIKKATRNKEELLKVPDYYKIFPTPTAQQLAERYDGVVTSGGASGGGDDDDDGISWG
jgi:hypothetical protein